jgi:predicted GNAT family acetyltransferase
MRPKVSLNGRLGARPPCSHTGSNRDQLCLRIQVVPEELQGQGIAGKLAAAGLEFARQKGLTVIPLCPFVAGYVKKHQQYLDLVQKEYREGVTR